MKKVDVILLNLFSLVVSISFAQWTSVGAPDFTSTNAAEITLELKQNGNPVVAYRSNGTDSIYAMECVANNWIQLASTVTPTAAYQPQITLDQNDIPHVIYRNINDSIFIKKWNGTTWENFGSATGYVNKGNNALLKFNSLNEPFVAFSNYSVFGGKCSVMNLNSGVWNYYISTFVTNFQAVQLDFNIASNNTVYVIAQNSNGGVVSVYKSDGSVWSLVGPTANIANGIANFPKITIGPANIPYIFYGDNSVNVAATVRKWNGVDWELVGNQGFSVTSIGFSDLKIVNGIPTVIFQNGSSQVMQFENGIWSTYGNILGLGNSHALAIRNDNTVFAAYNNAYNGYKLNVKKFCTSETSQATNAICQGQTYSFGNQTLNTAGSYSEVFSNSDGCDSLVNLSLTILPTYSLNQSITLCDGESLQIGNSNYTQSGNYQTILTSQGGCDSTIYTQLTIVSPVLTSEQQTICEGDYFVYNGDTLTSEADYEYMYQAQNGCDSTHIVQLTIENALTPIIAQVDGILSTSTVGDNFQWIDCNGNLPITGALSNEFTPINDGDYAVEVTNNQCTWLSDCYTFSTVSLPQNNDDEIYFVYPNPASTFLTLDAPQGKNITSISLMDQLGRVLEVMSNTTTFDLLNLESGVYFLTILEASTEETILKFQVVK
ncbi:MAG: T9SS type A sorting domain-containing protein [Crocinitomicaceae bacterium]|nr:T9SS type A sorting domain-containing protein [Crocinitomicaceae bacterium]